MATGRRVLVVEDEMLIAMLIEDALTDAGMEVVGPVAAVEAALTILENEPVDSIVLDMNLNGRNAMPIADAAAEKAIPFIVMSGYGHAAIGKHHAAPVLSKPFNPAKLIEILHQLNSHP